MESTTLKRRQANTGPRETTAGVQVAEGVRLEIERHLRTLVCMVRGERGEGQTHEAVCTEELEAFTRKEVVDLLLFACPALHVAGQQLLFPPTIRELAALCIRILGNDALKQFAERMPVGMRPGKLRYGTA